VKHRLFYTAIFSTLLF